MTRRPSAVPVLANPALAAASLAASLVLGGTVLGHTPPAHSHAIESSLERLSGLTDQLVLDTRFGNGEPADDAVVRLVPPGGAPIEVGRTDASGQLRFRLPQDATAAWEVQVDRGPGHRDYLELPGSAPAPATSSSTPHPARLRWLSLIEDPGLGLLGLSAVGGALGGAAAVRRQRRRSGRP